MMQTHTTSRSSHRARGLDRGFTLIEAIVVIVIIGVLAGIIAPPLFRRIVQSKQSAAAANAATIAGAVENYRLDYGELPQSLDALVVRTNDGKGHGPYINNSDQLLDPWGRPFRLVVPPQKNADFDIVSDGEDGQPGGPDDIVKP
ncbi:MAG TPA: type II secretion system major pseudopilin GspG [Phycisphaerales bacterium]|nr:type II secretion system major pseudopilin GspG [Phycisphaerales bacterium]